MTQPNDGLMIFAKGDPSPYSADYMHRDGVNFHLDKERVDFTVLLQMPTQKEIFDYCKGRVQFGLCIFGPAIFLLSKFGGQPWSDAPYGANLVPSELRGMPEGYAPGMRIGMRLMLINSSTNIILGLRFLTLSAEFSEVLAKEIKNQLTSPVSRSVYEQAISDAYVRHPSARSMKKHAIIFCSDCAAEELHAPEPANTQSQPSAETTVGAGVCLHQPEALEHITLTTSEVSQSLRGESSQATLDVCRDLISLSNPRKALVPIPGYPEYTVMIAVSGTNLLAAVFKWWEGGPVPVATVGVALDAKSGVKLWRVLHENTALCMPIFTDADSPPSRPWIASRLELGTFKAFDAMQWLVDFECSLAWAFAKYVCEGKPLTR